MPQAARITDAVAGTTAGNTRGMCRHIPRSSSAGRSPGHAPGPCGSTGWLPLRWEALPPSGTGCCGSSEGTVGAGSGTVRINGKAAARMGDAPGGT